MTTLKPCGKPAVRAKLVGLHKATKRLSGGRVAVYAYASRGGALIARAEGRDLADANTALERVLGRPDILARLNEARKPIKRTDDRAYVRGLIAAFKASPEYARLGDASKTEYARHLKAFDAEFGAFKVRTVEAATVDIVDWRDDAYADRPRTADYLMGTISRLFGWAKGRKLASHNPVEGIERLHRADRSDLIWTDADLVKLCAHASVQVQAAVRLAAETGLRMGDLLTLTWSEVSDHGITKRTSKRGRQVTIPLTDEARRVIAGIEKVSPVVLTNSRGKPWTRDGFKSVFQQAKADAGITGLRFHDLRGTAATRMALTALTPADLAGIFGWSPEHVQALLTKYVSRDAVALDLLTRMKQKPATTNRLQTGSGPKG
jgi:integrase